MLTKEKAQDFAQHWVAAWNAHDLDQVLSHYTDDFEMTTPLIASLMNEPSGTLKGKANVGEYWKLGLQKYPDLKFELLEVLNSVNSITIYYKTISNKNAVEFFLLNDEGKAYKAIAHYN